MRERERERQRRQTNRCKKTWKICEEDNSTQNFIRPRSHSNQGPHNLHSKQACRESFEKKEVLLSSSGTTTVLPACLPARGTHDRRKRREKRHDSGTELAASWQSFACARFESPTLGSLRLCTETVSSTSPVHVSRVMKFGTIAVRSGRKQHTGSLLERSGS